MFLQLNLIKGWCRPAMPRSEGSFCPPCLLFPRGCCHAGEWCNGRFSALPHLMPGYEHCFFGARQAVLCFVLLLSLTCRPSLTHRYGKSPENETEAHKNRSLVALLLQYEIILMPWFAISKAMQLLFRGKYKTLRQLGLLKH